VTAFINDEMMMPFT